MVSSDNDYTKVKYHYTDVVKFNFQEIILNSGGWHTLTTKTRMNQASNQFDLGYCVSQKDFEWFVDFKDEILDFYDNMKLDR